MAVSKGNKAQEGEARGPLHRVFGSTGLLAEKGLEGPGPIDTAQGGDTGNGGDDERRDRR
jgi:hypothetical protein